MNPRALSVDAERAVAELRHLRYPPATGELQMWHNDQGSTVDRVLVLLDSPGPPSPWGGWHSPPLRVLVVPIGSVPMPGQAPHPVEGFEDYAAREMARLLEENRALARRVVEAQYRLMDPACHLAALRDGKECKEVVGLPAELGESTTDSHGKPHLWCWPCWYRHRIEELEEALVSLDDEHPLIA